MRNKRFIFIGVIIYIRNILPTKDTSCGCFDEDFKRFRHMNKCMQNRTPNTIYHRLFTTHNSVDGSRYSVTYSTPARQHTSQVVVACNKPLVSGVKIYKDGVTLTTSNVQGGLCRLQVRINNCNIHINATVIGKVGLWILQCRFQPRNFRP